MVSLPVTPEEKEEKDDSTPQDLFQTPTKGSLLASSEEQQPPVAADDPAVDGPRAPEPNCTDGDEAVDLGKDSDLEDLFQTPTEGSLLASSEEQQPLVAADDPAVDGPRAPEPNCTDGDEPKP